MTISAATGIAIERIDESERARRAAKQLVFEYIAMTGAETGRGPWNKPEDLPERLWNEYTNLPRVYRAPGAFFVAFANDEPVGCAGLHEMDEARADIRRLYVREGNRGAGIASLLMDSCLATAQQAGFDEIVVDIVPGRISVIEWYRRLGFTDIEPFETIGIELVYLGKRLSE